MLKRDLYVAAMKAGNYKKVAWMISAFSITREGPEDWKKDPYPYRIVFTPTGTFFVDPDNQELGKVEDAPVAEALYRFREKCILKTGEVPNFGEGGAYEIETSYGNIFFNWAVMVYAFGNRIGYYNPKDKVKVPYLEDQILTTYL